MSEKLEQWKKQLLDLTRRNRLLYLTEKKAQRSIEITSPNLRYLIDAVVNKGHSLTFPMLANGQIGLDSQVNPEGGALEVPVRKGDLEVALPIPELSRSLYRLRREWLTWQEEQGIHTLFLVAGFLKWKESSFPDEEFLAPVILIPVGLERKSLDEPYALRFVEEDIVLNPALSFKLSTDFGIELPDLPLELDGENVEQYLRNVESAVEKLGWQVLRRTMLGKFTYEKFVMYNDLTNHRKDACDHPVTRALAKVSIQSEESLSIPRDLDEVVNPLEVFPILDADSSQIEVLLRARHRENLVIQGPPGTGKSQTIANLIAQALRDGMRVLFVSEKMAALEVVNRRLQFAGLSFACLEVHSHHSDKSKVVQELARTLSSSPTILESHSMEQYEKLVRLRDRLNKYVRELHLVRGALNLSAFQVHGRLAKLSEAPKIEFTILGKVVEANLQQLDQFTDAIVGLQQLADVFDNLQSHPWNGVRVEVSDQQQLLAVDTITSLTRQLARSIPSLQDLARNWVQLTGLNEPSSLAELLRPKTLAEILVQSQPIVPNWLKVSEQELKQLPVTVAQFKTAWQSRDSAIASLQMDFDAEFLKHPVREMLDRFTRFYRTPFRALKSGYRNDRAMLKAFWKRPQKLSYHTMLWGLTTAVRILDMQLWLQTNETMGKAVMGQFYQNERTNWDAVVRSSGWFLKVKQGLGQPDFPPKLAGLLTNNPEELSGQAEKWLNDAIPLIAKAAEIVSNLSMFISGKQIESEDLDNSSLSILAKWLDSKQEPQKLRDWLRFQFQTEKCKGLGLDSFVKSAIENKILAKDLRDAFLQRFWIIWLSDAYRQSPTLGQFDGSFHEQTIQEFRLIENQLKNSTIQIVKENVARRQPKAAYAIAKESQRAVLLREAQKRRRIKPLRKLFEEIPQLLQQLKPCLLMSPLSVASYLGTSPYNFDIVIFDEASQIPPADAIGSILRGSRLIVAGDNRQLPPTRFFQSGFDLDEESAEEDIEEPLESILDECLALPAFKPTMLKWHYRSRNEQLIDFSNKNIYNGELVTFPSPDSSDSTAGAVELLHVSNGVYDRGGSRKNIVEAEQVAGLIEDHFRRYGSGTTLGVITFSIAQEEAISEQWDRRKLLKPDLAPITDSSTEPFFIKSLEKVQGDERDRIIISLGYGKDSKGVLSMNFGPLNQTGGERRLNVAVTRARSQVVFVSSVLSHEVDPARLTKGSRGVGLLKKYLEYASNGGRLPTETYGGADPETDFEYEVMEGLQARGLDVDSQVGCSDFRIDLAIRHPKHKNRYVLGVECDGATYHSHRSARDRDKLRQDILENLGWKIHRVWSTDWVTNSSRIVEEIFQRVQQLSEDPGVQVPVVKEVHSQAVPETPGQFGENLSSVVSVEKPAHTNPYGFPEYEPFVVRIKGRRGMFYYLGQTRTGLRRLANEIQLIVNKESPVHIDEVARKMAGTYGIGRVGSIVESIMKLATRLGASEKMFKLQDEFLWSDQPVIPRIPRPGDRPRPIEEVADEEISAVLRVIVEKEMGITRDSLIKTAGRVLGYDRSGLRVESRIGGAVDHLLKEDQFILYGDQITLKPPENQVISSPA